ncbi:MAG: carbohydrate-binding domain-containing protein, partial [Clostridia bacterium]|nr:carbohydrate-binding domain-containing protein [Clostridia bacterium]
RKSSKTITLTINSADLQIDKGDTDENGNPVTETVTLEVPAQIVSDRTLVPIRAISEAFGLNVKWDEDNSKVIITSNDDEDDSWKQNTGTVNLSNLTYTGKGIEINKNQILITSGGDYTITGTLKDGNITVSTDEKVKLRLSGVSVTSSEGPCIYFENADKGYITLTEKTENYLTALNSDNGAIYAKDNLEIKGNGVLNIESSAGHAIKASDNLTIENGTINLNAYNDGIHINDTFKMTGGTLNITAVGDGIDSESIVNISGGKINIETNGVPIESETASVSNEATNNTQAEGGENFGNFGRWMMQETANVEFEKSSKGINADWMMVISGGEININSASHSVHCADEIEITGGTFALSSKYEKGISAHGNLTISNSDTVIDIAKSTEGLESKNIMTINDGVIKVVSTDDAINATGGTSGTMIGMEPNGMSRENMNNIQNTEMPANGMGRRDGRFNGQMNMQNGDMSGRPAQGELPPDGEMPMMPNGQQPNGFDSNQGDFRMNMEGSMVSEGNMGMRGNLKDCLVINGGDIELYAEGDCLDANGNIIINGGTIKANKANGPFSGTESIIDLDGQVKISENANIILAAGLGSSNSFNISQNSITVYCKSAHNANDRIEIKDSDGKVIYEYTPAGKFSSVLISSNNIETGKTYTITIGNETYETKITEQNTVIGTISSENYSGFGRRWMMQ